MAVGFVRACLVTMIAVGEVILPLTTIGLGNPPILAQVGIRLYIEALPLA